MDRLTAMRVFVTVVDLGSQSAAADHLEMSRPVVSRYLAELEDWIGARLMHRTTRKLSLTAAGSETLPRCRQLLELSGDLQAAVRTPDEAPRGLLRISVSTSFGQAQFADAMTEYVRRFPGVNVDLQMLDRTVNLVDERIDLAIRASNDLDPNLIARRLTVCRSVICASPAYLREHPAPQRVEDLSRYNCLTHSYFGKSLWHFEQDGEPVSVPVQGNISANEASTLLRAAVAGAGISMLPTYQAWEYLRSGELVRLLAHAEPRTMDMYAVYASRKHMPATLRSMLDFLVLRFPEVPVWDKDL
ncbi:LysR family transcriptional regulator [Pseudomonas fuscovaginae UPB0736]|uniref:Transcriptional regulator, LysR family n=1 Tax=Pseudomonas asplenii TaxID=53407 RepID=A0A1H6NRR0_9PSED|nr:MULTISPECIES: LysR family transcriptional regulator [Pseudomonas]UUQ66248.1 LysR family transcriptional regulator [Pseudomonas fuscovaginae UPB0736]UZE30531.1 LysR family transcriptional regulator [Pseudomonas asplenii]SEI13430.1 transcriptional regulator, LysR family [Pseudomonas fuscovaginae]